MPLRTGQVLDEYQRPVPGASVYVYNNTTGAYASLTSDGTAPIAQPITTDEFGVYSYQTSDNYYREDTFFGGKLRYREVVAVGNPGADLALRTNLAQSGGAALVSWLPATGLQAMDLQTALRLGLPLMLEHFGAVGDGVANDYPAYKALVAQINALGHGVVALAHGKTYHIDAYVNATNGVVATDTQFLNLKSLVIHGNGAKIDLKGNFNRDASTTYGLTGLLFNNCSNVRVFNVELDGNVDAMTNGLSASTTTTNGSTTATLATTSGIVAGMVVTGTGIAAGTTVSSVVNGTQITLSANATASGTATLAYTNSETLYPCGVIVKGGSNFDLHGVYAHHFSTDGFALRGSDTDGTKTYVARNIRMFGCRAMHNARQGMTIEGARGVTVVGGEFSYSGYTDGTYGQHAPYTGIDIEPNFGPGDASPNTRDENTGDVVVDNVRFSNNLGGSIRSAGNPGTTTVERVDTITVRNCKFIADTTATTQELVIGSRGSRIYGNDFALTNNYVQLGYSGLNVPDTTVDIFFRDNIVRGHGSALIYSSHEVGRLIVEDNYVVCDATGPWTGVLWNSIISNVVYENNRFYVPSAAYNGGGSGDAVTAPGSGTSTHRNNRYETNLAVSGSQHFCVSYSANSVVENDKFVGAAAGTADTFRPLLNSTFNTGGRYNRGHRDSNPRGSILPGNGDCSFSPTQTPRVVDYAVPITADRAVTLSTTNAFEDCECTVIRRAAATGAFNINVGTGPLKAMGTAGTWATFRYISGAWSEIASGSL